MVNRSVLLLDMSCQSQTNDPVMLEDVRGALTVIGDESGMLEDIRGAVTKDMFTLSSPLIIKDSRGLLTLKINV